MGPLTIIYHWSLVPNGNCEHFGDVKSHHMKVQQHGPQQLHDHYLNVIYRLIIF